MNLYYTGENGSARKFVEEMESTGTASAIRAEEGNLRYDYFISREDPETVLLIDSWASQKALPMTPGTIIAVPAEVKHWHGAAKDSWFQHLTYHKDVQADASNEWLEPVTDEQYNKL